MFDRRLRRYRHPCHDARCGHTESAHHVGEYPAPEGFGPNRCLVAGCRCTDYTYPPWAEYPSKAEWERAVRGEA